MKKALLAGWLAITTFEVGCQVGGPARLAVGEEPEDHRVVGWRLVERTYGTVNAGHAGDGEIPADQSTLVYQPVFEETAGPIHDCGAVRFRSACPHDLAVTLRGGLQHAVDSQVIAEGRIASPAGIYHEISIETQTSLIEILGVRGAMPVPRKCGRYFLEGSNSFEVVFTSHSPGRSGLLITVIREIGRPYVGSDVRVASAPRSPPHERER